MAFHDSEITQELRRWQSGDKSALDPVFQLLYNHLKRQAAALYGGNPSPTLQPTALVNEAYLRLANQQTPWQDRGHFFAVASVIMRRILVDAARERGSQKRGAGLPHIQLEDALALVEEKGVDLILLNGALDILAEIDPRQARIVELRFFAGLSEEEIAEILGLSAKTVQRGWGLARAWLRKYMLHGVAGF
jgi:RNA polymerase sigma factor (TIGR02999 family)